MADRTGLSGKKYVLVKANSALVGADDALRKLDELIERFPRAVPALVRSVTEQAAGIARGLAPRRSGALVQSIRTSYHDDQWTGAVFVAPVPERDTSRWKASTLAAARKRRVGAVGFQPTRPAKFPVWLEFGTRRAHEHPFLLPAGRMAFERMKVELPQMIDRFVKDAE